MKVLQIGRFYPPHIGGIEKTMQTITEKLNEKGIKCDVLCYNHKKSNSLIVENIEKKDISYKVYRLPLSFKFSSAPISFSALKYFKTIIKNYDILHFHHPDPWSNLILYFIKPNQKIILHWHSDIIRQKYSYIIYKPFLNWLLKRANIIIATSPNYVESSQILKNYKNKCKIVPIGIRKENIKVNYSLFYLLKKKYEGKKIIFSLGRFIYYKGFEYLIEAARYLDSNYLILLAGDGPKRKAYENLIRRYNLKNKVQLVGKLKDNEIGAYYKFCNLFCLPSIERTEAFGIVMIEAMSFKKPIVSTNVKGSGVTFVNKHKYSGLVVEPRDSRKLAEAIKFLLQNKKIYKKYSNNAYKHYLNLFTADGMVDKIIDIFLGII